MPDPPRRRRSTQPPPPSSSMLPTIALGIGVVIAGLGIGALFSALQHRGESSSSTTSVVTSHGAPAVTPVARPTRGPLAQATVVPHPTESPTPRPTATPKAEPTGTPTPAETGTPRATPTPQPTGTPKPTPTPAATATPRPTPRPTERPRTPAPARTAAQAERPTPRPTARPTERPVPTSAPVQRATPVTVGGIAQNTVRRYLSALIAGNENAAYAELGKAPGEPGASLSEESFIDRGTRITSIRTASTDANGATVEVELTTSRGSYFATYHVTNGPNGPIIDQHDYIRV